MHFKDDPISGMHAKIFNYLMSEAFAWVLKIWSRLFRRGPVEYNYPFRPGSFRPDFRGGSFQSTFGGPFRPTLFYILFR